MQICVNDRANYYVWSTEIPVGIQARNFVWEGWVCPVAKVGLKGHDPRTLCTSMISCTLLAKQGKLSTAVIMHANMFMCSILVLDDQCPGKLG